jgi:hypothetical protein
MRRIKHNPKTVGVVTYYCGRNIFYFRIYSDLASASTYDRCPFLILFRGRKLQGERWMKLGLATNFLSTRRMKKSGAQELHTMICRT